jgi:hypothetical protein
MVEAICINDKNYPKELPENKRPKLGEPYHVIYTLTVLPQKQLAFLLHEIELTENEKPYEYFLANRFAFTLENLLKLRELIKDCTESDFDVNELMEQCQLQEV